MGARSSGCGPRAADLVFGPTLACGGGGGPGGGGRSASRRVDPAPPKWTAWLLLPPAPTIGSGWAGLTPKPHHAQQPKVALRGSFRLRLASTCNHRPARGPSPTLAPCSAHGGGPASRALARCPATRRNLVISRRKPTRDDQISELAYCQGAWGRARRTLRTRRRRPGRVAPGALVPGRPPRPATTAST